MFNERWFKVMIWSLASFYFFLAACVLISLFSPAPDANQQHTWMSAMMGVMMNSLMGLSMQVEEGSELGRIMIYSAQAVIPVGIGGLCGGLLLKSSMICSGKKKK